MTDGQNDGQPKSIIAPLFQSGNIKTVFIDRNTSFYRNFDQQLLKIMCTYISLDKIYAIAPVNGLVMHA